MINEGPTPQSFRSKEELLVTSVNQSLYFNSIMKKLFSVIKMVPLKLSFGIQPEMYVIISPTGSFISNHEFARSRQALKCHVDDCTKYSRRTD